MPSSLAAAQPAEEPWLWSTAYAIPKHTTNQGSGYFSIIEGHNGRLYIGTAKYGENSYLVEFDTKTKALRVVVDVHKAIGTNAKGFAAQSKIHTRNNVGASGKIYFATKQGYPQGKEKHSDYPGGYPMVYDPKTEKTQVFGIPIPHQGIIDIRPDEARGVAYLSTCSDGRPKRSGHFMVLDLKTGKYTDLLDCDTNYAFIVIDHQGRAYHPIAGGDIARYDPATRRLERLTQTIDGKPPEPKHPLRNDIVNWDISPDGKTFYCVPMTDNQLYGYDLSGPGKVLAGRRLGPLYPKVGPTDCRAMCVGPKGEVWMGVTAGRMRLVSYRPGDAAPRQHGPVAIKNPNYTDFTDKAGKPNPWHHGVTRTTKGIAIPQFSFLGVCAARNGLVYLTSLAPFTLHEVRPIKP